MRPWRSSRPLKCLGPLTFLGKKVYRVFENFRKLHDEWRGIIDWDWEKAADLFHVFIFNVTRYDKLWQNGRNRRYLQQIVAFGSSLRRKLWKLRKFNVDIYFWIVARTHHISSKLVRLWRFLKSFVQFTESFIKSPIVSTKNWKFPKNLTNLWKCRWFGVWRTYNSKGESEDKNQISCPCRIVTISLRSFAKNSEWDCNSFFICNQWHWICFCIMLHTPPITHLSFAWDRFKVKPVNFYFTTIQSHLSCIVFP